MTAKCRRCGEPFDLRESEQARCFRCLVEVTALIHLAERRQQPRHVCGWTFVPKDMTWQTEPVL